MILIVVVGDVDDADDHVVTPWGQNPTPDMSQPCLNQRFLTVMLQGRRNRLVHSRKLQVSGPTGFESAAGIGSASQITG